MRSIVSRFQTFPLIGRRQSWRPKWSRFQAAQRTPAGRNLYIFGLGVCVGLSLMVMTLVLGTLEKSFADAGPLERDAKVTSQPG